MLKPGNIVKWTGDADYPQIHWIGIVSSIKPLYTNWHIKTRGGEAPRFHCPRQEQHIKLMTCRQIKI